MYFMLTLLGMVFASLLYTGYQIIKSDRPKRRASSSLGRRRQAIQSTPSQTRAGHVN